MTLFGIFAPSGALVAGHWNEAQAWCAAGFASAASVESAEACGWKREPITCTRAEPQA